MNLTDAQAAALDLIRGAGSITSSDREQIRRAGNYFPRLATVRALARRGLVYLSEYGGDFAGEWAARPLA